MNIRYSEKLWLPALFLAIALFWTVYYHLDMLQLIPGDIGDARLNNYFLENVYLFIIGKSESLWHLPFFYPFSYVIGFSDNLFGSSPFYLIARLYTGESDTAFQLWFLFGYVLNFCAAYYALRRLGGSTLAATAGALIFAFALPTTAHIIQVQLHYRFALPLAVVFFAEFLNHKDWRACLISGIWLVWQFYCGVYMGFFTMFFIAAMIATYCGYEWFKRKSSPIKTISFFIQEFNKQPLRKKIYSLIGFVILLLLIIVLFYPYVQVSDLYGVERVWGEISTMLPRVQSYFLADRSYIWSGISELFSGIPMRHEHQMFIGLVPLALAVAGFIIGAKAKNRKGNTFVLMTGVMVLAIGLTLYIGGDVSLWLLFYKLPLASAIRAVSRIDQAMLFPIAYFSVIAIDALRNRFKVGSGIAWIVVLPLLVLEFSAISMHTSTKDSWRQRLELAESVFPKHVPDDSILFMAQTGEPHWAYDIDAMWVAQRHQTKTFNGYSGHVPSSYAWKYGADCIEVPKRILSYLNFMDKGDDEDAYRDLMNRVIPIGFANCKDSWLTEPLKFSISEREYTPAEFRALSYEFANKYTLDNTTYVEVKISNSSNQVFASQSKVGKPIRLSWRFLDDSNNPVSGWDNRKGIPFDIPANGSLVVGIPIDLKTQVTNGTLQVSLVQEGVFWAHDIGIEPISMSWDN